LGLTGALTGGLTAGGAAGGGATLGGGTSMLRVANAGAVRLRVDAGSVSGPNRSGVVRSSNVCTASTSTASRPSVRHGGAVRENPEATPGAAGTLLILL